MSTYRKLFHGDGFSTFQKQGNFDGWSNNVSPLKEQNNQDNQRTLSIPQQFSGYYNSREENTFQFSDKKNMTTPKKQPSSDYKFEEEGYSNNKIIVVGFDPQLYNLIINHFKKFGRIEDFEYTQHNNYMVINYSSSREALYALEHYNKMLLGISKERIILAERYKTDSRSVFKLEEKVEKRSKQEEKYSTTSIPSRITGLYYYIDYLFNW